MTTVLIVGSQGVLGLITADVMRSRGDVTVLIGGRRPEAREDFRYIDLGRPETIAPALAGVDFAISTVADPQFELERIAVETGARSINISSAVLPAGGHASLRGRGLAIVHAGLAPLGLQALIAKELLKRRPDAARLEVAMCFSASGASGPQGRELAYAALTRPSRGASRTIPFGAPVGARNCFLAPLPDADVLHTLAPDLEVGIYVGFSERLIHGAVVALRSTRIIKFIPRTMFTGHAGPSKPADATDEPLRQWVAVYDAAGKRVAAIATEGSGDYRSTAIVTRAFLDALIERLRARKPFGVHGAERMFELDDLRPHLPAEIRLRSIN